MVDGFPAVERILDPSFLLNDFYTNTMSSFSARFYIAHLYIWGAELFGVHYTFFIAYANIVRIFLTYIAAFFFAKELTRNTYAAVIATCIVSLTFFTDIPRTVGWGFITPEFSGHNLSLLFSLIGLTFFLQKRLWAAVLLYACAMIFHPVVTMHTLGFSFFILLFTFDRRTYVDALKRPELWFSFFILLVSFFASYIPLRQALSGHELLSASEFVRILGDFRHPHHYIPTKFGAFGWIVFGTFVASFVVMLYWLRDRLYHIRAIKAVLCYMGIMMVVGYVFVEVWPIKFVVTLIPYRSLYLFPLLYIGLLAYTMHEAYKNRDLLSFWLLHIPFLSFIFQSTIFGWKYAYTLIIFFCVFFVVAARRFYNYSKQTNKDANHNLFENGIVLLVYIFAGFIFLFFSIIKLDVSIPNINDENHQIYKWLQNHSTPSDTLLVDSGTGVMPEKVRLLSRRSVVASEDFPFLEIYYKEWFDRFTAVFGSLEEQNGYLSSLSEEEIRGVCSKFGGTLIVCDARLVMFELVDTWQSEQKNIYLYECPE